MPQPSHRREGVCPRPQVSDSPQEFEAVAFFLQRVAFDRGIADQFYVKRQDGLELITVRHYNEETINNLKKGMIVLFEERLRNTMQMVVKNVPPVERRNVELPREKG